VTFAGSAASRNCRIILSPIKCWPETGAVVKQKQRFDDYPERRLRGEELMN